MPQCGPEAAWGVGATRVDEVSERVRTNPTRRTYRPVDFIDGFPRILGFPLSPVRDGAARGGRVD